MGTSDFLAFGGGSAANVIDQSTYGVLAARLTGFKSGTAQSAQLNKVWRQSSIMAAVVAQFIVNQTGQNATDDGTTTTLLSNLATAVAVSARQNPVLSDVGTATNTYAVANLVALTAYPTVSGLVIDVSIANANTGASTLNVDSLGAKPIYGLALQSLQGGELIVKGVACFLYVVASTVNSGNGAWVLMECTGGAQQVAPATQSQHAVQLGQLTAPGIVPGRLLNVRVFMSSQRYIPTTGTSSIIVEGVGGGGGSGGSAATSASTTVCTSPGSPGAYAKARYTSGFSGLQITVGAGGPGGGPNGQAGGGGTSSFGSLLSCPGGQGSYAAEPSSGPILPAVGGGAIAPTGSGILTSLYGLIPSNGIQVSTGVAANFYQQLIPFPGAVFGMGGGGIYLSTSTAQTNGNAGNSGAFIIWEFA